MSLTSISERIASLSNTHKECMVLIARLSKLSAPGSDAARTELANLIHQTLREAETEHEFLVDETRHSTNTSTAIPPLVSKAGEDLKIARRQYRKALLTAKHSAVQAEREALFGARRGKATAAGNEKVSQKDLLVSASSDVTAALRRTQHLMQGELAKSRFAAETLAQSTEALRELGQRYSAFDDVLAKSKDLIRDLVKKNKSDRWYYEKAIQILIGTLVWIIVRRLFWGPLWLLVVWPLKTAWWATASVVGLSVKGKGNGIPSSSSVYIPTATDMLIIEGPATQVVVEQGEVVDAAAVEEGSVHMRTVAPADISADAEDAQTLLEVVGKIIDGESTTIVRNTKSRRFEELPEQETQMAEAGVADVQGVQAEADTETVDTEGVHDEL